jgi:hypothetical protein
MSLEALPRTHPRGRSVGFWIVTGLFSALMAFSAVAYLTQPMMAGVFQHLGFPPYFRVELAIAKLMGVAALLAPVPEKVKEWAYAGFGITLVSAIVAHSTVDGPAKAVAPAIALALLAASYLTRSDRQESNEPRVPTFV